MESPCCGYFLAVAAEQQAWASGSEPMACAALAVRIRDMQCILRTSWLPEDTRIKLQQKLLKVCDAMKAREADPARAAERLDQLQVELQRELDRRQAGSVGQLTSGKAALR
jgi:uncharacterized protein YjhX (UPF0386 family)